MKFGLFHVCECPDNDYRRAYKELLGQVEYGEELGFNSVWLGEHHGSEYGCMPHLPVMGAAISQITDKMRIGAAVSILPFQNPVRVAEDYAMIDVLSNGRLDMGVGRGYQPREFAMLGLADQQAHSREIFNESLEILIGCWENEHFSYHGKHFQLDDVRVLPRPVQKPRPPIYVAAISPQTFDLVDRHGLNIMLNPTFMPPGELKQHVIDAKRKLVASGRDPKTLNFPMNWQIHLAETQEEAEARPSKALDWYYNFVMDLAPKGQKGYEYMSEKAAEAQRVGIKIKGLQKAGTILLSTPKEAIAAIEDLRDSIGQQEILCWMRVGGLDDKSVRKSMKIFAEEVMPHFADEEPVVPEAILESA